MPKSKGRENHQRGTVYSCDPMDLWIVGLDEKTAEDQKSAKDHPLYDARVNNPVDPRLVTSMLESGWFGCVEVKREGGRDVVVAGRSRVRAARTANEAIATFNATKEGKANPKTPIRVDYKIQRSDVPSLIGVMISENELRTDDTIPNKARKAALYLSHGKSVEQCAGVFGVSKQSIKNWLMLLEDKNADVLRAIERGQINPTAAYAICKLEDPERSKALKDAIESGASGASVRDRIVRSKASRGSESEDDEDDEGEDGESNEGKRGKRGTDSELPHEAPGKRLLKKLYAQDGSDLDPEVRNTIGWVLGFIGANRIKGLVAACREVNEVVGQDP